MNNWINKLGIMAAVFFTALPVAGQASQIDFGDLQLNDAQVSGNTLTLTDGFFQASSAFIPDAFSVDGTTSFSATFSFLLAPLDPPSSRLADGITFTIHNDSRGAGARGSSGTGLGVFGVEPSLSVAYDIYDGPNIGNEEVQIIEDGSVLTPVTATSASLSGTRKYTWIDYDSTTLNVFLSDTNTKPGASILSTAFDLTDLGGSVFFGFTGATGGFGAIQTVSDFHLTVGQVPAAVPLPAGFPLLLAGLGAFALMRKRKAA